MIAISGLGRMGMQIAQKLAESGTDVIAHNRSNNKVDEAETFGARKAYEKADVVAIFKEANVKPLIWIMVPADVIESELKEWLDLVPEGSVLIDGGNTDYRHTREHAAMVASRGSTLLDIGTSGGVWGYARGFSMMVGGDQPAYEYVRSKLISLSSPSGGEQYFGEPGSGHYVKMVHNAIEYGMMQSLAEGYRMLKEGPYEGLDLVAAGDVWQQSSVVTSWLNELTRDALKENPTLEGIDGFVAESGEARWTIETAKERGIPLPAIEASFDVRLKSQQGEVNFATKLLSAMRNKFGGHQLNK